MCKPFTAWGKEIHEYCKDNGLDFSKAEKSGKCWGSNVLMLQHIDPQKGENGLKDETPAPVTLIIKKINGCLIFEQTKYTKRYLVSK